MTFVGWKAKELPRPRPEEAEIAFSQSRWRHGVTCKVLVLGEQL